MHVWSFHQRFRRGQCAWSVYLRLSRWSSDVEFRRLALRGCSVRNDHDGKQPTYKTALYHHSGKPAVTLAILTTTASLRPASRASARCLTYFYATASPWRGGRSCRVTVWPWGTTKAAGTAARLNINRTFRRALSRVGAEGDVTRFCSTTRRRQLMPIYCFHLNTAPSLCALLFLQSAITTASYVSQIAYRPNYDCKIRESTAAVLTGWFHSEAT